MLNDVILLVLFLVTQIFLIFQNIILHNMKDREKDELHKPFILIIYILYVTHKPSND